MKVTMQMVADRCGVSKAVVSRILNEDPTLRVKPSTRKMVIEMAEQLDYHRNINAQMLSMSRKQENMKPVRIGYLTFSSQKHTGHPYFSRIIDGINAEATQCNAEILIGMGMDEARKQSEDLLKTFADNPLDGMIVLGRLEDSAMRRMIGRIAKNVVCMDKNYDKKSDYVGTDASKSILLALEHLHKMGHTEFGLLYGGDDARREACLKWLENHELSIPPEWQIDGEFTLSVAQSRVEDALKEHKPPTAIIACNDEMAIGCIRALQQAGYRVPADVAVTGHDDIMLAAYVDVPLTTVHIYKKELGRLATKVLLDRVQCRRKTPISVEVACKLVRRDSCGYNLRKQKETD